jgi:hypothetical protein
MFVKITRHSLTRSSPRFAFEFTPTLELYPSPAKSQKWAFDRIANYSLKRARVAHQLRPMPLSSSYRFWTSTGRACGDRSVETRTCQSDSDRPCDFLFSNTNLFCCWRDSIKKLLEMLSQFCVFPIIDRTIDDARHILIECIK